MGSRIIALVVLLVGLAAVAWVAFGRSSDTTSLSTAPPRQPIAPAAATAPTAAGGAPAATTSPRPTTAPAPAEPAIDAPPNYGPRRDLVDLDGWLNTDATSLDDFDGKVILLEIFTFGCSNCKARIPFTQSYAEEFADENFQIVGVHAPEFSHEADVDNIINALAELGVTWPVALDTDKKNFRAWQPGSTSYWPRTFVIDQNGDVRYDHIGEGRYEELREVLRHLLDNPAPAR